MLMVEYTLVQTPGKQKNLLNLGIVRKFIKDIMIDNKYITDITKRIGETTNTKLYVTKARKAVLLYSY